ncbi:MAG: bis(5'-nucleosyl)-tetraphosphatase (symmetrical) YqeK [Clostridia bacterium]|nr:bis(5'-nucleosyl)-tetraphosphatase (symmetrical) YqeK [Clostridia bacterium]
MDTRTKDQQFTQIIRARLGDYRYHHSLCVAEEARRLAERYGADPQKAYTAGLLHDIMKDTAPKTQLQILSDFGILLDEVEQQSKTLWHARSGAVFLRHILGVTDEDILQAVRYHTTGRAGMSLLEKVLFVADFTSADRDYEDVDVIRCLADEALDSAIQYGIDYTIRDLLEQGRPIHPNTLAAYNDIVLSEQNGGQTNEQ